LYDVISVAKKYITWFQPAELLVQQNEKFSIDYSVKQQKKVTSSCVTKRLSGRVLAKVVHISSAVNIPEAAILPNA